MKWPDKTDVYYTVLVIVMLPVMLFGGFVSGCCLYWILKRIK